MKLLRWFTPFRLILFAVVAVYANSFWGVFLLDDGRSIGENLDIQNFWSPWRSMFSGINVTRPRLYLSLSFNWWLGGLTAGLFNSPKLS